MSTLCEERLKKYRQFSLFLTQWREDTSQHIEEALTYLCEELGVASGYLGASLKKKDIVNMPDYTYGQPIITSDLASEIFAQTKSISLTPKKL